MNRHLARTIRSMLVQLDGTASSAARLALARQLARGADATLSAMFVASSQWAPTLSLSDSPGEPLQTAERAAAGRAQALFNDAAASGPPAMQWLEHPGVEAVEAFRKAALYADLLVLGQRDATAPSGLASEAGFVESTLIGTGRPAIIVPRTGQHEDVGHVVLIGWRDTPQAVHAVSAALPWLQSAREVHVLEAGASPQLADGASGIEGHLHRHGIHCVVHADRRSDTNAGEALLSLAGTIGADLLVMGCYGHSRARELVLGGATRAVLERAALPVLMAH